MINRFLLGSACPQSPALVHFVHLFRLRQTALPHQSRWERVINQTDTVQRPRVCDTAASIVNVRTDVLKTNELPCFYHVQGHCPLLISSLYQLYCQLRITSCCLDPSSGMLQICCGTISLPSYKSKHFLMTHS